MKTTRPFTLDYQIDRHCAAHAYQWPHADRGETRSIVRALMLDRAAWLWREPQQMGLFENPLRID